MSFLHDDDDPQTATVFLAMLVAILVLVGLRLMLS